MDEDELIARLEELAGPLGPLVSVAGRREEQDRWADAGGEPLFDALIDLLAARPLSSTFAPELIDDIEVVIVEVLSRIAGSDPDRAQAKLASLLREGEALGVAIDVLGAAGGPPAVQLLGALCRDAQLDEATRVRLASALGELGGAEARAALGALADSAASGETALLAEIAIARQLTGDDA